MLQTLDLVLAFAVIMAVLSLLVTIVVQVGSALLALRGKNLANGLALTFQTIDPHLREHAYALAEHILRDPIFSDSALRRKNRAAAPTPELKVKVEALAAVLKTAKAKEAAEKQIAQAAAGTPEASKAAPALAGATAEREKAWSDLLAASAEPARAKPWRFLSLRVIRAMTLASAVRPGEIYRLLNEWKDLSVPAALERGVPPAIVEAAGRLLGALKGADTPADEAGMKVDALKALADKFDDSASKLAVIQGLASLGNTVERATTQAYDRFQRWFGSAQDRAEQWFRLHVRGISVAASISLAFLLQLDTLEIFRELRARPEVVAALVRDAAPAVLQQGRAVLDAGDTPAYHAYREWLRRHPLYPVPSLPGESTNKAYADAIANRLKDAAADPAASLPVVAFTLEAERRAKEAGSVFAAYAAWEKMFPRFRLDPPPLEAPKGTPEQKAPPAETAAQVAARIVERVQKIHQDELGAGEPAQAAARARWQGEFDVLAASGRPFLDARRESADALRQAVEGAGFDLVPASFWGRWDKEAPRWGWPAHRQWLAQLLAHFLGMALTAGLLTLGAPFWFNLLKNLSGLRPALATLIERRPQSAPALPSEPAASPARTS